MQQISQTGDVFWVWWCHLVSMYFVLRHFVFMHFVFVHFVFTHFVFLFLRLVRDFLFRADLWLLLNRLKFLRAEVLTHSPQNKSAEFLFEILDTMQSFCFSICALSLIIIIMIMIILLSELSFINHRCQNFPHLLLRSISNKNNVYYIHFPLLHLIS